MLQHSMLQHIFASAMGIEEELKSRFRSEYQKARVNIYVTSAFLSDKFQVLMNSADLTIPQFNILRILRGQESKTLCISEIRSRMIDKNSDVSRIVDKLVSKGLVERTENEKDRRQKDIRISKKGLELLASMDHCEEAMDDLLDTLNENEVKSLNIMLDKIRNRTPKE